MTIELTAKRIVLAVVVGVVVLVAVLGATSSSDSTTTAQKPVPPAKNENARNTPGHLKQKEPVRSHPVPHVGVLTGFGATNAGWKAHHVPDTRFAAGAAYDPDPSVGRGNDRFNDRYYGVSHDGGTVTNYSMRFPPSMGIREAQANVLASEFPRDAKIVSFKPMGTCAQMIVRSATVDRATQAHIAALVEFTSGEAGDYYDASAVSDAIVIGLPADTRAGDIDC